MLKDELRIIKEAEANAEAMVKQAKAQATTLVEDAKREAKQQTEEADKASRKACQDLINQGQGEADKLYEDCLKDADGICAQIQEQAKANQDRAIKYIIEGIVG